MRWSNILKLVLGFLFAIALLAGGGVVAARIIIARYNAAPPKPMFPNDTPTAAKPSSTAASKPADTPKPSTSPKAKPLPSGAYQARVTQSIGLIVRDAPTGDSAQVGGVDYNDRVTVLEANADGTWQKIRFGADKEGWVRTGNVEQLNQ